MPHSDKMSTSELLLHEKAPLAGICVVDFGQFIAGPLTSRLLPAAGAVLPVLDRALSNTK